VTTLSISRCTECGSVPRRISACPTCRRIWDAAYRRRLAASRRVCKQCGSTDRGADGKCRPCKRSANEAWRRRNGIPERPKLGNNFPTSFWLRVEVRRECWEWQGALDGAGYGSVWDGQRLQGAHRVAWEIFFGPLRPGQHVCHRCDNPKCVNPAHLFAGTHADNMRDMAEKGRAVSWKLTPKQVRRIRSLKASGVPTSRIAAEMDVTPSTVNSVVRRATWRSVK